MKAELLSQLVEDRRNERAMVLATNLDTGEQILLYPLETGSEVGGPETEDGGPETEVDRPETSEDLQQAARTALLNDRSQPLDGPDGPGHWSSGS